MKTRTRRTTSAPKEYDIIGTKPVARFYYQGHHTHPIRRTVLIIEEHPNRIVGYEMREGTHVRNIADAPVKSYNIDKIAKYGDYSRLTKSKITKNKDPQESTLLRESVLSIIKSGA